MNQQTLASTKYSRSTTTADPKQKNISVRQGNGNVALSLAAPDKRMKALPYGTILLKCRSSGHKMKFR